MSSKPKPVVQTVQTKNATLFLAESRASLDMLKQAHQASLTDHPVLVMGETGTGKELVARVIHNDRGPLTVIDCTRLTAELADRELFGNVRGAYTGADQSLPGLFQEANGGSAFFDEIGELPFETQSKLLRVLQEKHFRPVGSTKQYPANFRIIAATNRNLKHEVEAGRFRQDLYFRLNVIKLIIPPLRTRPEDVRLLLDHYSTKYGIGFSAEAKSALLAYQWPGNVRELEGLVARMAAHAESFLIGLKDLSATITGQASTLKPTLPVGGTLGTGSSASAPVLANEGSAAVTSLPVTGGLSLSEWKRLATAESFLAHHGNRKNMASELKVSRATIHRRLKEIEKDEKFCALLSRLGRSALGA